MKKFLLPLCLVLGGSLHAQISGPHNEAYTIGNPDTPCVTTAQREAIFEKLALAKQDLIEKGILPNPQTSLLGGAGPHPLFEWPIEKDPAAPYTAVWGLSNYVDHNASFPNQIQDWNCGTKSYDTSNGYNHQGMDIFLWPFSWYQFQNNYARVVAAAPGTIIYKDDGNFDMNCALGGGDWNAIYVMHADGSIAWYGHMKSGTLTSKGPGDTVTAGEFLGNVGSSGSSTGPHLHFEVYNNAGQLVDPYVGTCNLWTSANDSWWAAQKPYIEPKINAVSTHSGVPTFPTCPQTEVTKYKDSFLSNEVVYAMVFLTDQTVGSSGLLAMKRPNGTVAFTQPFNSTTAYNASYWWWSFGSASFDTYGLWTLSFSYNGNTVEHQFVYGSNLAVGDLQTETKVRFYPNPALDRIAFSEDVATLDVFQIDGKKLQIPHDGISADVSGLPNGVFLLRGTTVSGQPFTSKLTK